jgi:hypothetical protein
VESLWPTTLKIYDHAMCETISLYAQQFIARK